MSEPRPSITSPVEKSLREEIARLNKVLTVLMDRAERSTRAQGSDFGMFQTTIMLEDQVRQRTAELQAALRENDRTNRALRESESKFRGLANQSLIGITITEDDKFSYANPRFADMFGYRIEDILEMGPVDIAAEIDRPLVAEQVRRSLAGGASGNDYVFRGQRGDGAIRDIECHNSVMDTRGKPALISLLLDITERTETDRRLQALQSQLQEQAIHDPLTGLYNRQPLNEFFDRELDRASLYSHSLSVVMADLDHFKSVNDTNGHCLGDEVLRVFSDQIRRFYRAGDIACRYGGEEFLIILPGMTLDAAMERTELLRAATENTPVNPGGPVIHVTASFGIATFPQHGLNSDDLITAADNALYAAKHGGRNQVKACALTLRAGINKRHSGSPHQRTRKNHNSLRITA